MEKRKLVFSMKTVNKSIIVTNDDGYKNTGLEVLKNIAKKMSNNVWVVAPEENQSAKSHSITINKPIKVKKIKNKEFIVKGTPVDCVIIALKKIISKKNPPYLLLSGINDGVNMGLDSYYSGTISAAREGSFNGIKSVALSIEKNKKKKNWQIIELYLPKILKRILAFELTSSSYFNINFPNIQTSKIKGLKFVKPGKRKPGTLILQNKKKTINLFTIPSARKMHKSAKKNIDEYELKKGYIVISIYTLETSVNSFKIISNKDILG